MYFKGHVDFKSQGYREFEKKETLNQQPSSTMAGVFDGDKFFMDIQDQYQKNNAAG